jgi:hypothetical protein
MCVDIGEASEVQSGLSMGSRENTSPPTEYKTAVGLPTHPIHQPTGVTLSMHLISRLSRILAASLFAASLLTACEKPPEKKPADQQTPQQPQKPTDSKQADTTTPPPATSPAATAPATNPPPATTPPPATNPPPATTPPPETNPPPADPAQVTEASANAASEKILAAMKDANAIIQKNMEDPAKIITELKAFVDPREKDLNDAIKTIRAYRNTLDETAKDAFHEKHTSRPEYQDFVTTQDAFNARYPDKVGELEDQMNRVQGEDDDGSVQDVSDTATPPPATNPPATNAPAATPDATP